MMVNIIFYSSTVTNDEIYLCVAITALEEIKVCVSEDYAKITVVNIEQAMKKIVNDVLFRFTNLVKAVKLKGHKAISDN